MIIEQNKINFILEKLKEITNILETSTESANQGTNKIKIIKPFAENFRLTQGFGENPSLYKKWGYAGHFGLDWALPIGTALLACDVGFVKTINTTKENGNYIILNHWWGSSILLHMREKSTLQIGERVEKGQFIGWSGNTGFVIPAPTKENTKAGAHVHFSIKVAGLENKEYNNYVDPTPYIDN